MIYMLFSMVVLGNYLLLDFILDDKTWWWSERPVSRNLNKSCLLIRIKSVQVAFFIALLNDRTKFQKIIKMIVFYRYIKIRHWKAAVMNSFFCTVTSLASCFTKNVFLYKLFLMNIMNVCRMFFWRTPKERLLPTSQLLCRNYRTTVSKKCTTSAG